MSCDIIYDLIEDTSIGGEMILHLYIKIRDFWQDGYQVYVNEPTIVTPKLVQGTDKSAQ